MPKDRSEALLREYAEISSTFRMLTDIRFKLLAFLPVAAAAAAAVVAGREPDGSTLAFAMFGLVVTVGLVTYNTRNDQLYDTLVARAATVERALGIPDGAFANRPRAWLRFGGWAVDHRTAVASIYYASAALWLFGVLDNAASLTWRGWIDQQTPSWLHLAALAAAIVLIAIIARLVNRHREHIADVLRDAAAEAVGLAMSRRLDELADDDDFRRCCSTLAGIPDRSRRRRWQQTRHERDELCGGRGRDPRRDPFRHVAARIDYLAHLEPGAIGHYVVQGSGHWTAAQMVASLTDLAPEWLYDCATSRRRRVIPRATTQSVADSE
jgi:hypothetical protein